ncbi:MAG: thioredoxin domain-containing protein [Deltaproteobacteria bacterium]|nr:thioredoxin domain-containing protein [Deltaproteobacteria bacterium]
MARLLLLITTLVVGCSSHPPATPAAQPANHKVRDGLARTECHGLQGALRDRAVALLDSSYIHDCCDEPLTRCLGQTPRCLLATRLANNICRRLSAGQDDDRIKLALSLRARMMQSDLGQPAATIDLTAVSMVGERDAPVTVVEYAGPRGEHCARLTPLVHRAVVAGPLAGKVKLYLKPFALRSNPHSKEAGVAFLAAQQLNGLWPFVLHAYEHFESFTVDGQAEWAAASGLDRARFEELASDPAVVQRLIEVKKEGLENGVKSTPSFFINGRRYEGELAIEELVDVLEETYDRSRGLTHEP